MDRRGACPRCGSLDVVMVVRVPWSTESLAPEEHLYLQCEECGHRWRFLPSRDE
ncbi:MAG: hypothetical protein ACP5FL_00790 [Thermoplasmatota archaeon]